MNSVILINDFGVDIDLLNKILIKSNLPESKILLVLSDGYLPDNLLGCCIPRSLVEHQNYIGIFNPHLDKNWEQGVALSVTACEYRHKHPAFFTYLLAHELGHAYVCITEINVHIHYCLIQDYISEAKSKKIHSWHQLPHEILFDQFGIFIAESIFSPRQMKEELNSIIENKLSKDLERIENMLLLPPFQEFKGLREKLINFSIPYKDTLISLWERDKTHSDNPPYLLKLVHRFEDLFV